MDDNGTPNGGAPSKNKATNVVQFDAMFSILIEGGVLSPEEIHSWSTDIDINANTALNYVAQRLDIDEKVKTEIVEVILNHFPDHDLMNYIDKPNNQGETALRNFIKAGNESIALKLIEYGAKIHLPNINDSKLLNKDNNVDYMSNFEITVEQESLLSLSIKNGMGKTVKALKTNSAIFAIGEVEFFNSVQEEIIKKSIGEPQVEDSILPEIKPTVDPIIEDVKQKDITRALYWAGIGTTRSFAGKEVSLLEYAFRADDDTLFVKLVEDGARLTEEVSRFTQVEKYWANRSLNTVIKSSRMKVVKALNIAAPDFSWEPTDGDTDLHRAAIFGRLEIFQSLHGSEEDIIKSVDAKNADGLTPLHYAAICGNLEVLKILLHLGANIKAVTEKESYVPQPKEGMTALSFAAFHGNLEIVNHLIDQEESLLNMADKNGDTPLHLAVWSEHDDVVSALIERKANINARNNQRDTPLHVACRRSNLKTLEALIAADGISVNLVNGLTNTPLHVALNGNNAQFVEALLGANGILVNKHGLFDSTPLHIAAWRGNKESVIMLLNNNADFKAKDENGKTPKQAAKSFERDEVVKILEDWEKRAQGVQLG